MVRNMCTLVCIVAAAAASAQTVDIAATLERAHELASSHHYADVLELLQPLAESTEDSEALYSIMAELGRAHFHLGQYRQADDHFRRAVTLHPERIETALYLQASSFLTGNREQALMIFREVVRSGASDLYLAVTLPGERAFLADPEVWSILDRHARPLALDALNGSFLDTRLGQTRHEVETAVGAVATESASTTLTARAGPKMIWALSFDESDTLAEIIIDAEHLLRYTPYRLELDDGVSWSATPAEAVARLGPPAATGSDEHGNLLLTWTRGGHSLSLEFGRPQRPRPGPVAEDAAMLLFVRVGGATPVVKSLPTE